ncbi:MAG: AAA family ATPase [Candidatus Eisenbacteria sp.]|nr:AAA family ATPase [Candidatus Eisenbacteria bacterium]
MKRKLYQCLLAWKGQPERKPLLLQGTRQVGKTYLLKEFGRREYSDVAYLNFEQSPELGSLFESSLEPKSLIATLGAALGKRIEADKTLLILDEIQTS